MNWVVGIFIAIGMSVFLGPASKQEIYVSVCVYLHTQAQKHTHMPIYIDLYLY